MTRTRLPGAVAACLFDLDGVLTDTASVHMRAWKETFDAFLATREGEDRPFDESDYKLYVDGKTRQDGVRNFLESRHVDPTPDLVKRISDDKNDRVLAMIDRDGVEVFDGSIQLVRAVREDGLQTAVVSSSANTKAVLASTGIADLFDAVVDGTTIADEHLAGKPAPDSFLRGSEKLGVEPSAAAVFEDALAGVQAGRAGHFATVVGVDREGDRADDLRAHGADIVVRDLGELIA